MRPTTFVAPPSTASPEMSAGGCNRAVAMRSGSKNQALAPAYVAGCKCELSRQTSVFSRKMTTCVLYKHLWLTRSPWFDACHCSRQGRTSMASSSDLLADVLRMAGGPGHAFGLAAHCKLTLRGGKRNRTHVRGTQLFYNSTAPLRLQYRDIARCVVKQCLKRLRAKVSSSAINRMASIAIGELKPLSRARRRRGPTVRLADAG